LCHAIVGPLRARQHLSEGMRLAAFRQTKMARELAMLQAVVSSAMESVLGCSPSDTFCVDYVAPVSFIMMHCTSCVAPFSSWLIYTHL
jgi:hypothetical protein